MRVLLATDGSREARAASAWLHAFPLPSDAEVRVLTAVELPGASLDTPAVREYQAALLEEARSIADRARADVATRWPASTSEVATGDPREAIPRAAAAWGADLVVVGARGLGAFSGMLLGSVSSAVVRHAACPVLVVKGAPVPALRMILVAADGSPDSETAPLFLASLPLTPAVAVRFLAVVEPPHPPIASPEIAAALPPAAAEEIVARRREELERVLARLSAHVRTRVAGTESSVVVGRPADEIVRAARDPRVDLVVVGARGLGPIRRLLLGSVSERVLHHVERPVLIVKSARA